MRNSPKNNSLPSLFELVSVYVCVRGDWIHKNPTTMTITVEVKKIAKLSIVNNGSWINFDICALDSAPANLCVRGESSIY